MGGGKDAIRWIEVGRLEDIPRQGARTITTAAGEIAVFRTHDDLVFALDDLCPHKGGKLSQGIVHGHAVTCPLHNWVIDCATGEAQAPDNGRTRSVAVRVECGRVMVAL